MSQITPKQLRALVKSFPWDEWNEALRPGFEQHYRDLVLLEGKKASGPHDVEFDMEDPFLQKHMTAYVGERIVSLSKTTQKDVTRALRTAFADADENLTANTLQDLILETVRQKFGDYAAYRALRIARTESAIAYNHGGVLGGMQAGFKHFEVFDGTDDEACAEANGSIWPARRCLQEPVAHPNCVRSFAPTEEDES